MIQYIVYDMCDGIIIKQSACVHIQVGAAGGNAQGSSVNPSKMEGNVLVLSNNNFTTKAQFAEQYKKDLAAQAKTMADKDASDIYKATKKFYNIDTMKEG